MPQPTSINRQSGWTIWGLIVIVALITFFTLLTLKLFPPYMDNFKIKKALHTIAKEPGLRQATRREIIRKLDNMLYIDYVHKAVNLNQALIVEKRRDTMTLRISYEVIVPLAYNISALLEFDDSATVN